MKKLLLCLSLCFILLQPISISALENEKVISTTIEYLDNGSYFETTIIEDNVLSRATKTGHKTATYYDENNVAQWYVKVTGTFSYSASGATCTSSSVSAGVYKSTWKIASKSSSKSGNKATAKASANQYYNVNLIDTRSKSVSLTCSTSGKLY